VNLINQNKLTMSQMVNKLGYWINVIKLTLS